MTVSHSKDYLSVLALLVLLALLSGCTEEKNLLSNANFQKWAGGPEKWHVEGDGAVKRTKDGAELTTTVSSSGFLYQRITAKRRHRGATIILAALVRSDTPDSAVIEFSDRRGTDRKSEAHPGYGQWRLMQLTVKVPEESENLEFRLRNYKGGVTSIKEAVMGSGAAVIDDKASIGVVHKGTGYRLFGMEVLTGLLLVTVVYFRRLEKRWHILSLEVSLVLLIAANMMLVADKVAYAAVTSTVACVTLASVALWYAAKKKVFTFDARAAARFIARPGAFFIVLSALALFVCVYALANRDILLANKASRFAFWFMITGALLRGAGMVLEKIFKRGRAQVRIDETPDNVPGETIALKAQIRTGRHKDFRDIR